MKKHRQKAVVGFVSLLLVVLGGCSTSVEGPSARLTFSYEGKAAEGFIDQSLSIGNSGGETLAPHLQFIALDRDGRPLPEVRVSTVYGSDRGLVAVPAEGALDILTFEPTSKIGLVADVSVTVRRADVVDSVGALPVDIDPLSAAGDAVQNGEPFASIQLRNPNPLPARVRVVLIVYDNPPPGRSQQAASVLDVAGPLDVPPGEPLRLPVDTSVTDKANEMTSGAVSLKAYLSV